MLFIGLVGDVGLHYCDRKMIKQEVRCRYQPICKALQSCKTAKFSLFTPSESEYEHPPASALDLIKFSNKCNNFVTKNFWTGGQSTKKKKKKENICFSALSLKKIWTCFKNDA